MKLMVGFGSGTYGVEWGSGGGEKQSDNLVYSDQALKVFQAENDCLKRIVSNQALKLECKTGLPKGSFYYKAKTGKPEWNHQTYCWAWTADEDN